MKQIVDLIPMAAFVLVFIWKDIFAATMALLVGLIIQIAIYKMARWEVQKYMYVILVIALASGGLTLILQDSMFIKLRSTIVSVFISILIGGSQFVGEKKHTGTLTRRRTDSTPTSVARTRVVVGICTDGECAPEYIYHLSIQRHILGFLSCSFGIYCPHRVVDPCSNLLEIDRTNSQTELAFAK